MTHRLAPFYIALCFVLCLLAACGKEKYHQPVYARADAPAVATGSWWRYQVRDSIARRTDTLTLTVASTSTSGSALTAYCYVTDTGTVIDSGTMTISDTSISFSTAGSRLGGYHLRLPLQCGESWQLMDSDRISVLPYLLNVDIHKRNYYVFDITRRTTIIDNMLLQHIQLSRNIGVVFQGYSFSGLATQQRFSTSLIDYHLN